MFGSKTSRGCTGLAHMRANLPASCQLTKQDYELADFKIDLLWCISITSHHRLAMVVWHRLQRSSRGTLLFRCLVTSSTASTVRKRLFGRGKSAFHVVLDGTSDFSLPDQGYAGTKPGVRRHQTRGTRAPDQGYAGTLRSANSHPLDANAFASGISHITRLGPHSSCLSTGPAKNAPSHL
jgi:hypothetical protein